MAFERGSPGCLRGRPPFFAAIRLNPFSGVLFINQRQNVDKDAKQGYANISVTKLRRARTGGEDDRKEANSIEYRPGRGAAAGTRGGCKALGAKPLRRDQLQA